MTPTRLNLIFIALIAIILSTRPGSADDTVVCSDPLPEIFQSVSRSVVLITASSLNPYSLQERIATSLGTGFIVRKDGIILTNAHVVFGKQAISVSIGDGHIYPASMVGADPILDLAVVKIEAMSDSLPVLKLKTDRLPQVGEEALAIGNPLGFEKTLTRGVVSGVDRVLPISPMSMMIPMIQTDASINPGNSGGPLTNRCGEVIGMNTSVLYGAENMGFALPSIVINDVLPDLIQNGRIIRPWLGVRGKMIKKKELRRIFNFNLADGFLIEMVEPGSPADKSGLVGGMFPIKIVGEEFLFGGDIITHINKTPIDSPEAYYKFLESVSIGDKAELKVLHENKTKKVTLTIVERPLLPWDLPRENCSMSTTME